MLPSGIDIQSVRGGRGVFGNVDSYKNKYNLQWLLIVLLQIQSDLNKYILILHAKRMIQYMHCHGNFPYGSGCQ